MKTIPEFTVIRHCVPRDRCDILTAISERIIGRFQRGLLCFLRGLLIRIIHEAFTALARILMNDLN